MRKLFAVIAGRLPSPALAEEFMRRTISLLAILALNATSIGMATSAEAMVATGRLTGATTCGGGSIRLMVARAADGSETAKATVRGVHATSLEGDFRVGDPGLDASTDGSSGPPAGSVDWKSFTVTGGNVTVSVATQTAGTLGAILAFRGGSGSPVCYAEVRQFGARDAFIASPDAQVHVRTGLTPSIDVSLVKPQRHRYRTTFVMRGDGHTQRRTVVARLTKPYRKSMPKATFDRLPRFKTVSVKIVDLTHRKAAPIVLSLSH